MVHKYLQQVAGRAGARGFTPHLNHLIGRRNFGFLKATFVAAAVLAGLSI